MNLSMAICFRLWSPCIFETPMSAVNDYQTDQRQRLYVRALLNGDDEAAFQVIHRMLLARRPLGDVYLDLLTPALVGIGQLWCDGEIGVGLEKLASHLVLKHMDRMRGMHTTDRQPLRQRILVACVEGELHCIGARMVADLLDMEGWPVDFLGADVPTASLIETIKIRRPHLVALSVRTSSGLDHARRVVRELKTIADAPKIILGGQGMARDEWPSDATCLIARDAVEGVQLAGKLLKAGQPKAVLKEYLIGLGRRVRELRNKKGWTQEQLAESARLTRVSIVAVEGGKQNISMNVVLRLANSLGTSPEDLLSSQNIFQS
jgi:methanogenic corrinoid protein MtbC1/DNA-binding XRE family transcriptional regulator